MNVIIIYIGRSNGITSTSAKKLNKKKHITSMEKKKKIWNINIFSLDRNEVSKMKEKNSY
jgi:hypothetical protein